jgi:hypothetical protein
VSRDQAQAIAAKYLFAIREAGKIYRHIEAAKGKGTFVTEISMDETDLPQTPLDLWFILAAVAEEGIPVQTIAPKFSGRFNKGVDFVGDLTVFDREFQDDLAVIAFAIHQFGLPASLKLSVHSGSDKFSLYPLIRRAIAQTGAGLHLKTAGTTWLEEVAGIAQAGGDGLALAKEIYGEALSRFDELAAPYATVIDIDRSKLPSSADVAAWTSEQYVAALAHDPGRATFNSSLRQLIHVGYKVAAERGSRFRSALDQAREAVAARVTANLWEKHLAPLFVGKP